MGVTNGLGASQSIDGAGFLYEVPGPILNTYFDGNTPDAGDFEYVWSGTANASRRSCGRRGILGVTDDGVYQSQEWAAEGTYSAFVPEGKSIKVAVATPSRWSAESPGQVSGSTGVEVRPVPNSSEHDGMECRRGQLLFDGSCPDGISVAQGDHRDRGARSSPGGDRTDLRLLGLHLEDVAGLVRSASSRAEGHRIYRPRGSGRVSVTRVQPRHREQSSSVRRLHDTSNRYT